MSSPLRTTLIACVMCAVAGCKSPQLEHTAQDTPSEPTKATQTAEASKKDPVMAYVDNIPKQDNEIQLQVTATHILVEGEQVAELDDTQRIKKSSRGGLISDGLLESLRKKVKVLRGDQPSVIEFNTLPDDARGRIIVTPDMPVSTLASMIYTAGQARMSYHQIYMSGTSSSAVDVISYVAPILSIGPPDEPSDEEPIEFSLIFKPGGALIVTTKGEVGETTDIPLPAIEGCDTPKVTVCTKPGVDVAALLDKLDAERGEDSSATVKAILSAYDMREIYNQLVQLKTVYPEEHVINLGTSEARFPVAIYAEAARTVSFIREGGDEYGKFATQADFDAASYQLTNKMTCRYGDHTATAEPKCLFSGISGMIF